MIVSMKIRTEECVAARQKLCLPNAASRPAGLHLTDHVPVDLAASLEARF